MAGTAVNVAELPAQIGLELELIEILGISELHNFKTKISVPPKLVLGTTAELGSKSAVTLKEPIIKTLPEPSTEMPLPKSSPVPPTRFAQTKLPEASNFVMKTSRPPELDKLETPKVAVFLNVPVTRTSPEPSTEIPQP